MAGVEINFICPHTGEERCDSGVSELGRKRDAHEKLVEKIERAVSIARENGDVTDYHELSKMVTHYKHQAAVLTAKINAKACATCPHRR